MRCDWRIELALIRVCFIKYWVQRYCRTFFTGFHSYCSLQRKDQLCSNLQSTDLHSILVWCANVYWTGVKSAYICMRFHRDTYHKFLRHCSTLTIDEKETNVTDDVSNHELFYLPNFPWVSHVWSSSPDRAGHRHSYLLVHTRQSFSSLKLWSKNSQDRHERWQFLVENKNKRERETSHGDDPWKREREDVIGYIKSLPWISQRERTRRRRTKENIIQLLLIRSIHS